MTTPTGLRVVLAEDDVLLREGLASLLQRSGFQVVGQAGDPTHLLTLVGAASRGLVPTLSAGGGRAWLLRANDEAFELLDARELVLR